MDVRCERCGTEYELDDLLLSPTGTAVRCGQCRHAFRVRPVVDLPPRWTVHRDDGLRVDVDSLGDLCRRIRSGELAENDEIERSGRHDRRRLGALDELRDSFDQARTQRKPRPTALNEESARERTLPGGKKTGTLPPAVLEPPLDAHRPRIHTPHEPAYDPTIRSSEDLVRASSRPPPSPSQRPASTSPSTPPPSMPPIPPLRIPAFEDIPSARPPPRSPVPSAPAIKKPVLSLALDEEIRPRPTFTPAFVVGMIVTLLVAGGVVALAMKQRATSRTAEREAEIDHVRLPLLRDTGESYREVAAELGDAHALTPDDAVIVSAISTCHARWAQMLLDEAAFEPDSGRAATLRSLAAEHAQEAMRFATHALSLAPSVSFARFAQADAVRLAGDLDRAESLLRSASSASTDTVESSRILAALAADRSPVSEETRLASERALALARNDAQRLVLVARAAIARRDLTALDDALGRLGSASPTHRGIAYLARARETLVFDAGGVP